MPKNLDEFASELSGWLNDNLHQGRKRRKNWRQIYRLLCEKGYIGSYARVAAFASHWRQMRQEQEGTASRRTFVPLRFSPGEALQFDWSEETVVLAGESGVTPLWWTLEAGIPSKSHVMNLLRRLLDDAPPARRNPRGLAVACRAAGQCRSL